MARDHMVEGSSALKGKEYNIITIEAIKQALMERGIHYCYLDDFYTGASYAIKTKALTAYIQSKLDALLTLNINDVLEDALHGT